MSDPYIDGNIPPWDIGRPQPRMEQAYEEEYIFGTVLDIACGTGEHVIYFAKHGHNATGVDIAETGLQKAREKAKVADVEDKTTFKVWDVYNLPDLGTKFDTVTDSGFLHGRSLDDKKRAIHSVFSSLNPGGRYVILGFHEDIPLGVGPPNRLHQSDFDDLFNDNWKREILELSEFHSNLPVSPHPAYFAVFTKIPSS